MENAIYLAVSKQSVQRTNLDIIANNVANMNTPGFRGQNLIFAEQISDPEGSFDSLSFVTEHGQFQRTEAGPISYTGNQLDIALEGPGFIGIEGPEGEVAYTRAGNLTMSPEGILLNSTGFPVVDDGGSPIEIPEDSTALSIDDDGNISDQDGEIAKIMIVEFDNIQSLNPIGNTLYKTNEEGKEAENTVVKQGHLEGSNVQPIIEMTRLIEVMRDNQQVQRMVQTEHERLRAAIQKLTGKGS